MLHKTHGIVLSYTPYRETSIIVRVFTDDFGLQSYIENGVRSPKSKGKIALFQPLNILELVVYFKPEKSLSRISEVRCPQPFFNIPTDIRKTTIAIFLAEILSLTLKEHTENKPLFSFISQSLGHLETMEVGVENFHLFFLMDLSRFLGFGPNYSADISQQLGLKLTVSDEKILNHLIFNNTADPIEISRKQRSQIIDILIDFYRFNIEGIKAIKSVPVLKEILD